VAIKDQKQNKRFCEDENIQFNFLGTKIKIRYILWDEKTYLTFFLLHLNNTTNWEPHHTLTSKHTNLFLSMKLTVSRDRFDSEINNFGSI